jgi:hypothetical protein
VRARAPDSLTPLLNAELIALASLTGDNCKYRHALPPGFVLKSQRKKEEEDAKRKEITLEEFLEVEVRLSISLVRSPSPLKLSLCSSHSATS